MRPRRAQPLERLVDANPVWVDAGGEGITNALTGEPVPHRRGVVLQFDCPIHEGCWCAIPVNPPLDGGSMIEARAMWQRTGGEDFESVTLSPSIRRLGGHDGCEWHGFIRAGRFETCGGSR